MKRQPGRVVTILLAAAVVVGGANLAAQAANGKPLLLGKNNVASKTTTVHKVGAGNGAALKLQTKPTAPPLQVNSKKRVNNLNADSVDGVGAGALKTAAYQYTLPSVSAVTTRSVSFTDLPAGHYVASFQVGAAMSATGNNLICYFVRAGVDYGLSYGGTFGPFSTAGATIPVDTTSGAVTFRCNANSGTFSMPITSDFPDQVNFTKVDSVRGGGTAPAKTAKIGGGPKNAPLGR